MTKELEGETQPQPLLPKTNPMYIFLMKHDFSLCLEYVARYDFENMSYIILVTF